MKITKFLSVLIIIVSVASLNSCKKDKKEAPTTPSATVTADIDGVATTFNTDAIAIKGTIDGMPFVEIQGHGANSSLIAISIRNGDIIAGKTYTSGVNKNLDLPIITYKTTDDEFYNYDTSEMKIISVTITSVNSTSIEGTFNGALINTLINPQNHPKIIKNFTNGKFNVQFYQ